MIASESQGSRTRLQTAGVFLPLVLFCGWVLSIQLSAARGAVIRLPVQAYDPRDILSGQYLQYRVVYGDEDPCIQISRVGCADAASPECAQSANESPCICFDSPAENVAAAASWMGACPARPDCKLWIQGDCSSGRFIAGIERFYIPEEFAPHVVAVPEDSAIDVSLDGRGGGIVRAFYVQGKPLADYVDEIRLRPGDGAASDPRS